MVTTLSQLLLDQPQEIVARFASEVQQHELSPAELPQNLVVDHIPLFLSDIAAELQGQPSVRFSQDAKEDSSTARLHGRQRWKLGYDLEAVVREYGILRHAIISAAKAADVVLTLDDFDVLGKCLNVGVAEAVMEYVKYRDEELSVQKANLEFLAQAGELLSSSLDYRSTLSRLTRLLIPRLADWCAVHIEGGSVDEMPIAHVDPAKAELVREVYRRFPLPSDSNHGYPYVLRTGLPQLVTEIDPAVLEVSALNPEHLALLRAVDACSWLVVPLRVQDHMFGALTLVYSKSRRHYGEQDLVFATDLARQAALAIDNARLYQLSQEERSRAESATRAKDEFVAMVSHELRTPLNAILGWVRLMRSGTLPLQKREHAFEVIERNANAQNQLVADLLDISRAITGKIRIHPAQVDLCNVIDIALEDARLAVDAKRITIHTTLAREASLMRGDGDRLQQIVWNLLTNAIKFTPKGGDIFIDLVRMESDLQLTVRDTGIGITPEFLPHVFESFRQSDSSASRVHGGLGVGLSITKHLVDLHGGSIQAHSEGAGSGATFLVRLPVSPLLSSTLGIPQVPATQEERLELPLADGLRGLRALVVDDEPDARELIGYLLETCGTEVRLAESAAAALELLGAYTPDIIISDIGMPEEDGYGLIRSIRTLVQEDKRSLPAIALTAFARNEDRTRALVAGFNLHIAKPVEPSALVRAILDLVGPVRREPLP